MFGLLKSKVALKVIDLLAPWVIPAQLSKDGVSLEIADRSYKRLLTMVTLARGGYYAQKPYLASTNRSLLAATSKEWPTTEMLVERKIKELRRLNYEARKVKA
jgi:hypothetical protein